MMWLLSVPVSWHTMDKHYGRNSTRVMVLPVGTWSVTLREGRRLRKTSGIEG